MTTKTDTVKTHTVKTDTVKTYTAPHALRTMPILLTALALALALAAPARAETDPRSLAELQKAVADDPRDAASWYALANAWADVEQPEKALEAAEKAVELAPEEIVYLHGRAHHANWIARYDLALDSYRRVLALAPQDQEALLGRARAESWSGRLDDAIAHYRALRVEVPELREAWIELARCLVWRGDPAAALAVLDAYASRFGEDEAARRERARALASPRPRASLDLLAALLRTQPEDLDLRALEPIALAGSGRPGQARERLDALLVDAGGKPEIEAVARLVGTPMRTALTPRFEVYQDGDSVERQVLGFAGSGQLVAASRWRLEVDETALSADRGSGLAARGGGTLRSNAYLVGLSGRPWAALSLDGALGERDVDRGGDLTLYRLAARWDVSDALAFDAERSRDYHDVSPRALELEIARTQNRLGLTWRPTLRSHFELWAARDTFSDDNRREEVVVATRRQTLRRSRINLDLGLEAWWMGFDFDPGSGYWAPEDYRRYAFTGFGYWKIANDHGASFQFAAGWLRDDIDPSYRFGGDVALELFFGIYRDWQLVVRGAYSENSRQASGAFHAWRGALLLTRRFG